VSGFLLLTLTSQIYVTYSSGGGGGSGGGSCGGGTAIWQKWLHICERRSHLDP